MGKYIASGKGIRVKTQDWGNGELCATYKHPVFGDARQYRVRLGPGQFIDLPRTQFDLAETVIPFAAIKKLFATDIY